jgi:ceramide glucosyltransferase
MPTLQPFVTMLGFAGLAAASIYAILTVLAVLTWRLQRKTGNTLWRPPVTILKPLCGAEPQLYEHLRTFCIQDYPQFQIVFGVRDPADPACAVVRRLKTEFASAAIELVINPQLHGNNLKVSNLINMLPHARHDLLVMADSDAFVCRDYLDAVTAPLMDRSTGLVTCLYRGVPTAGIWSRLGAMYINEWYVPSVLLAWLFGHQGYVSGQTVCLRRDTLLAVGGLPALVNHLADDHRLGELVRALGLKIVLSRYVVKGEHHEPNWASLNRHELRWMRTIRVLTPRSFRMLFITFTVPLAAVGIAAAASHSSHSVAAWTLFGTTAAARLVLHFVPVSRDDRGSASDLWLLPFRDLLILWVWCRTFFTSHVTWRGNEFDVDADGVMHPLS